MSRTSEFVSLGHPDKIADYISEYILDKLVELDPHVRYALEVQIKDDFVSLAGEVSTSADVCIGDYQHWAKEAINEIGYTKKYQEKWGRDNTICGDDCSVITNIFWQSPDIAQGVNNLGWGDQGIFFGYAENNKYTNYMPLDYYLAKDLNTKLYENAKNNNVGGLDIKTQITLSNNNEIEQVIVAIPVLDDEEYEKVKHFVVDWLSNENVDVMKFIEDDKLIINGTGKYQIHGPIGDSGTTGRKLVADFYGGNSKIGGGSPWTKDGTKADLTLNLYARDIAVNKVKMLSDEISNLFSVETKISCCIGKQTIRVVNIWYDIDGNKIDTEEFEERPDRNKLIQKYQLDKSVYKEMCSKGLFIKI